MERIIFLDIDGTILDFDGSVRPLTIEAIRAARAAGHTVFLATGRPGHQIEPRIQAIGFDGLIGSAGGYAEYQGRCLYHALMPIDRLRQLEQQLLDRGCILFLQGVEKNYVPTWQAPIIRKWWKLPEAGSDLEREYFCCIDRLEDVQEVDKLIYFSDDLSHLELREAWSADFNILGLSFPGPLAYGAEIAPFGIDKVTGVRHVIEALGYPVEAVVAIGDNENDIEMLRFAGTGVAMGNGTAAVKAVADVITAPLCEDGLYQAFLQLGLFDPVSRV